MANQEILPKVKEFLSETVGMHINGEAVASETGATFETLNPATEEVLATVSEAKEADIDKAVDAAREAFDNGEWTKMPSQERSHLIYRFADLLEENRLELAQLDTLDNGKPFEPCLEDDVDGTVDNFRYYAGWATKTFGQTIPISNDHLTYTVHEPIGVVGQIIPWNFPLAMASWKLGAALAAGCTIVIKPAEQTPLSLLYAAKLAKEAGFPDGVLNVVPGFGPVAGEAIVNHKKIDKLAFTGSTVTGKSIMKKAADQVKDITLELGGKSPNIIFDDANLDNAIQGAFDGIMYNHGQNCSAGSRVYVQRSVYDKVINALVEKANELKLGEGLDESTDMGPLISQTQMDRVLGYIEKGKEEGAKVLAGGGRAHDKGYFVEPTIFADVKDDMVIAREEIFGPVVVVFPFDTTEEVIKRANDSDYGLAAGVWTESMRKGHYVASKIQAGTVWVNDFGLEMEGAPFGGYKQSGIGRELGSYALGEYTAVKSVYVNTEQE